MLCIRCLDHSRPIRGLPCYSFESHRSLLFWKNQTRFIRDWLFRLDWYFRKRHRHRRCRDQYGAKRRTKETLRIHSDLSISIFFRSHYFNSCASLRFAHVTSPSAPMSIRFNSVQKESDLILFVVDKRRGSVNIKSELLPTRAWPYTSKENRPSIALGSFAAILSTQHYPQRLVWSMTINHTVGSLRRGSHFSQFTLRRCPRLLQRGCHH